MELPNISEEVIKKILLGLDTSKAAGMDEIPAKFLKDGTEVLALILRNTIRGVECKIAKLKPIFKEGERTDP